MKNNIGSAPIDWADKPLSLVEEGASNERSALDLISLIGRFDISPHQRRIEDALANVDGSAVLRLGLLNLAATKGLCLPPPLLSLIGDAIESACSTLGTRQLRFDTKRPFGPSAFDTPNVFADFATLCSRAGASERAEDMMRRFDDESLNALLPELQGEHRLLSEELLTARNALSLNNAWRTLHRRSSRDLALASADAKDTLSRLLRQHRNPLGRRTWNHLAQEHPNTVRAAFVAHFQALHRTLPMPHGLPPLSWKTQARWTLLYFPGSKHALRSIWHLEKRKDKEALQIAVQQALPEEAMARVQSALLRLGWRPPQFDSLLEKAVETAVVYRPRADFAPDFIPWAAEHSNARIAYIAVERLLAGGKTPCSDIVDRWRKHSHPLLRVTAEEVLFRTGNEDAFTRLKKHAQLGEHVLVRARAIRAIARTRPLHPETLQLCVQALRCDRERFQHDIMPVVGEAALALRRQAGLDRDFALSSLIDAALHGPIAVLSSLTLNSAMATWQGGTLEPPLTPYISQLHDVVIA